MAQALTGALEWRLIGPHRGGRVVAVAGDPASPLVFYFGACAGGVWKTINGGLSWHNVSDGFFKTAAVGAIAVAESDPNVVYAGMGETCIRGNVSHGDGVYRSTDAGKTWAHLGLEDTRHIAKVRIHPKDPELVYVAALGHAYGPNAQRGLFRSRDGGKTWEQILFRDERTGAIDLAMDPHNPRILYAAFWEALRTPYSLSSGGPGSGLWKSSDGGDTWTELTNKPGLPKGVKGKIGVAVSPARPDRLWAVVEAEDGAVFRSDDAGESWQRLCEKGELRRRAWYYMHVYADPHDADTVWVLNVQCWRSIDGGATFSAMPTPHGDDHDLWIDPHNPQRMIEGNDGGACISFDGGASWSSTYNQPTAQFYHVTTDNQFPYRVYGSQQDNSALSLPSRSVRGAITHLEWYDPGGGESGYIAVRPDDPNIVFGGAIGSGAGHGRLIRYDHRTGQRRNITVWPEVMGMGSGAKEVKHRFQWTFPIVISPHDANVLYVAANRLFRSTDEGASWQVISPDLTRNDESKLQPSGGPITRDNTGAEMYCTIFAFVESPHQRGLFWAGTDDGLVHLSRDGGQTWTDITPPDMPKWALISVIDLSAHDPATAYVAATCYKLDEFHPYLFKTSDHGKSWQRIDTGIPETDFTRVIRADPVQRGLLFAGTETGFYVSFDDGASWHSAQGNLPVAPIYDLTIKDDDLIVATHGRSFWILDDITPLRQMTEQRLDGPARLFQPRPTYRFKVYGGSGRGDAGNAFRSAGPLQLPVFRRKDPSGKTKETLFDSGENPPNGVIATYYLKEKPKDAISLTFLDAAGQEIRTFRSEVEPEEAAAGLATAAAEGGEGGSKEPQATKDSEAEDKEPKLPAEAGTNRFVWDLRYPDAHKVPGDKASENLVRGPVATPGHYHVRLTVPGQASSAEFELLADPRLQASQADLQAQFDLLLKIRDKLSETHDAIVQLRDLRQQVDALLRRTKQRQDAETIVGPGKALKEALDAIEQELIDPQADSPLGHPTRFNARLATLSGFVDSADAAPTRQCYEVFDHLSAQIDAQLARLRELIKTNLAAFNAQLRGSDVPAVLVVESVG